MAAAVGDILPTPPTRRSRKVLGAGWGVFAGHGRRAISGVATLYCNAVSLTGPRALWWGVFPASFLAESRPGAGFWLLFFLWFQGCVV